MTCVDLRSHHKCSHMFFISALFLSVLKCCFDDAGCRRQMLVVKTSDEVKDIIRYRMFLAPGFLLERLTICLRFVVAFIALHFALLRPLCFLLLAFVTFGPTVMVSRRPMAIAIVDPLCLVFGMLPVQLIDTFRTRFGFRVSHGHVSNGG